LEEFTQVHPNPDDNHAWAVEPQEIAVTDKISGISIAEPAAKPAGSGSNAVVADKSQGEESAAVSTAPPKDHVTLTDSARSMQKIEEAVAKTPVVNSAKVAAVKQSISAGTYKIDAGQIASKLLNYERGLK
jgi:negative regulator of flagellin synthesis FlgM